MNKIISYIGFAIKSKQIIIGQSHLKATEKKVYLMLLCNSASDNLKNLAKNLASKYDCVLIETKQMLEELTHIKDVKLVGITNESLASAIIENKEIINIG